MRRQGSTLAQMLPSCQPVPLNDAEAVDGELRLSLVSFISCCGPKDGHGDDLRSCGAVGS